MHRADFHAANFPVKSGSRFEMCTMCTPFLRVHILGEWGRPRHRWFITTDTKDHKGHDETEREAPQAFQSLEEFKALRAAREHRPRRVLPFPSWPCEAQSPCRTQPPDLSGRHTRRTPTAPSPATRGPPSPRGRNAVQGPRNLPGKPRNSAPFSYILRASARGRFAPPFPPVPGRPND